ncbi:hypothetical protein PV414_40350, partial [Streptomyces scabiei]
MGGRGGAWVGVGLWVVVGGGIVPVSGKVSSGTTDSAVDTLPAGAESTKVAVLDDRLPGGDSNT